MVSGIKLLGNEIIDAGLQFHFAFITELNALTVTHLHDFYEIFLVVKGRINHIVNGQKHTLGVGSLVFIRPCDSHCYEKVDAIVCHLLNLAFTQNMVSDISSYLGHEYINALLKEENPPHVKLSDKEAEVVSYKLEEVNTYTETIGIQKHIAFKVILAELMSKFHHVLTRKQRPAVPEWMEKLCCEMHKAENLEQGISKVYELTEKTPEHIARTFKKYMGQTPTQYITKLRLNYARNLLVNTDHKIIDVCQKSGFESLSHFNHVFKNHFCMSPSKLRRAFRKEFIPLK